ncbi:MAG: transcription termination factor NusA [Kiritimatiellae bacterium]|nr:transcription termination factor NusA [Kiritimatiellia bacterium]
MASKMNEDLAAIITYLERERGVDPETVLQAIETSVAQAARKNTRVSADFEVHIDRKTYEIKAWDVYAVSNTERGFGIVTEAQAQRFDPSAREGDTVVIPMSAATLGRIVAQTAKQTIMQKIRDAERANVFKEYKSREGEIVSGSVKLVARKDVFVELGKTEAVMPAKECLPMEEYRVGDTVRAYVKRVQTESSGPAVVLSRADPEFVKALFRQEVAEVGDGSVEIVAIARDPGRRSKVAVRTLDPHSRLDPASACIGYQGSRVRAIVQELNNEKLDIVRYSDDPEIFVEEALKPAKISTIYVDDDEHKVYVTVPKDKLSLAIGRNGQNVRLASSLTGWRIEITADEDELGMEDLDQPISEEADSQSFENKRAELMNKLARDLDVEVEIADRLVQNGILSPEGVLAIEPALVKSFLNITDAQIQSIYEHAQAVVATKGV